MLTFYNCFSSQEPCRAWKEMMRNTCKTGVLNKLLETRAREQAKRDGCSTVYMTVPRNCESLLKQAGALAECPRLVAVVGSMPYYRFDQCSCTLSLK